MPSYEQILYGVQDRVATITFNRPDKLNAFTAVMDKELREAIGIATKDDAVRAIVITGAGRGFCAGADMGGLSARAGDPGRAPPLVVETSEDDFGQRLSYLLGVPKPVIAAINGPVAGIGFVLTLYCDLRYMAAGTKLSTSFARRGLIAEYGSAWMLPRLIGTMNALDLLMSGRTVTAEEAATMGLVRAFPAEGFGAAVQAVAADYAALSSPRSMGIIKAQVYRAYAQSLAQATQVANTEMVKSFTTEDFKEGVAHFVEKRQPSFTGR